MTNIYSVCVVDPNLTSHFRMALAERFPSLHEKTFALQVFLAKLKISRNDQILEVVTARNFLMLEIRFHFIG